MGSFRELYARELETLGIVRTQRDSDVATSESTGEPWVKYTLKDLVGLAFSGGGIRSATFNLGLLAGLNSFGLLKHVHILSTVSGGGYIGGWWMAWRRRRAED